MRLRLLQGYLATALILVTLLTGCKRSHELAVGSKNFTEQIILGEIISQHLEHRLNRKVIRRLNMGGTLLVHQALMNGQIDAYPEYSGTALTILKLRMTYDPIAMPERLRQVYLENLQLQWLTPLGFNNSFAMVVRKEDADNMKLETLSDAAKVK